MAVGGNRFRMGIRGRLLLFLGAAVLFILVMEILAQRATDKVAEEYQTRLDRYHLVHRMRVAFSGFREEGAAFLRDPSSSSPEAFYERIAVLSVLNEELAPLENLSIEAGFEVRAVGYGLDAYFPLVTGAVALRSAGKSDYYAGFAQAERIAGYIDNYLSRLLSLLLRDGEENFRALSKRAAAISNAILLGMIAASLLLLFYVYLVANSITRPIRRLAQASEKLAKGEMNLAPGAIKTKRRDEVGVLVESFYAMSADIRAYIESLEEKAELEKRLHDEETSLLSMGKALREAQFMNLQDQMHPHFLFNALNSIARNALLEGAPVTEKLTLSLARLLRSTIKEGGPYIPLGDEAEVVREYLAFQKVRFGARLDWEMRFDDALSGVKVPRFFLQPLVENAVKHGLEPRERGARIFVALRRRGEKIRAFVADTGLGISAGELFRLRGVIAAARNGAAASKGAAAGEERRAVGAAGAPPASQGLADRRLVAGKGIGLANLATRLYILYGEKASLRLYSRPGRGTLVVLSIPIEGAPPWPVS